MFSLCIDPIIFNYEIVYKYVKLNKPDIQYHKILRAGTIPLGGVKPKYFYLFGSKPNSVPVFHWSHPWPTDKQRRIQSQDETILNIKKTYTSKFVELNSNFIVLKKVKNVKTLHSDYSLATLNNSDFLRRFKNVFMNLSTLVSFVLIN